MVGLTHLDETLQDAAFYHHPNKPLPLDIEQCGIGQGAAGTEDTKKSHLTQHNLQDTRPTVHGESGEKFNTKDAKAEAPETADNQLERLRNEYLRQIGEICSKITNLNPSTLRKSSNMEGQGADEGGSRLGGTNRQKHEGNIEPLTKTMAEMEEQIQNLLNAQEDMMKHNSTLESRYKAAVANIEKEKRSREESELALRSEIVAAQGLYRKEKERAQKLMKTMAEMQSADPFKVDNTSISSSVKELRYGIRNWARAQFLMPSLPAQGVISSLSSRVTGVKVKSPNYERLKYITPYYDEYTEISQDFAYLLQAYVWRQIVDMIFHEDLWLGIRTPVDDEESDHKLSKLATAYHVMKLKLQPGW